MEQDDLERIRFVTRHFAELKGLQGKVPFGLFLSGFSFGLSLGLVQALVFGFLTGLGSLWLMNRADRYYGRRFGYVEPANPVRRPRSPAWSYVLDGPPLRSIAIVSAGLGLALVPFGIVVVVFRSLFCPLWGGRLLVSWFKKKCPISQSYYPVFSILLLGFARWNAGSLNGDQTFSRTNEIACGAVLILVGLLDHWQLVSALKPVEESQLAAEEEGR